MSLRFGTVSPEDIRAAQIFTGATLALWLGIGYVSPFRRYANSIRAFLLAFYLCGCVGYLVYVFLR